MITIKSYDIKKNMFKPVKSYVKMIMKSFAFIIDGGLACDTNALSIMNTYD